MLTHYNAIKTDERILVSSMQSVGGLILSYINMNKTFYALGDLTDDKFFRKLNDSDITQFNLLYPKIGATC